MMPRSVAETMSLRLMSRSPGRSEMLGTLEHRLHDSANEHPCDLVTPVNF
jgi:hypothetical protein